MNLPNQLTVFRLFLTLVFVACFSIPLPYSATLALAVFLLAAFTDYLDGAIARSRNLITDFGKLMDPLADKVMTSAAFICLIPAIPAPAVIAIIAREFLITGLRLLAGSKGQVLPAERLGKHKTGWQITTVIFYLILEAAGEWQGLVPPWALAVGSDVIGPAILSVAVLLTIYSGGAYFWRHRDLVRA